MPDFYYILEGMNLLFIHWHNFDWHIIFIFSDPKNEVPKEGPSGKPLHLNYRPINAYQPYLAPTHPTQLYFSSIPPGTIYTYLVVLQLFLNVYYFEYLLQQSKFFFENTYQD